MRESLTQTPAFDQVPHPAWCCGEWCVVTADEALHASDVSSWGIGDAEFSVGISMRDAPWCHAELSQPTISVDVDSKSAPAEQSYLFFEASPDELRLTANKLLAIADKADGRHPMTRCHMAHQLQVLARMGGDQR